jgi:hypothetical protein
MNVSEQSNDHICCWHHYRIDNWGSWGGGLGFLLVPSIFPTCLAWMLNLKIFLLLSFFLRAGEMVFRLFFKSKIIVQKPQWIFLPPYLSFHQCAKTYHVKLLKYLLLFLKVKRISTFLENILYVCSQTKEFCLSLPLFLHGLNAQDFWRHVFIGYFCLAQE